MNHNIYHQSQQANRTAVRCGNTAHNSNRRGGCFQGNLTCFRLRLPRRDVRPVVAAVVSIAVALIGALL